MPPSHQDTHGSHNTTPAEQRFIWLREDVPQQDASMSPEEQKKRRAALRHEVEQCLEEMEAKAKERLAESVQALRPEEPIEADIGEGGAGEAGGATGMLCFHG